jgi:hypothetical protein
MSIHTLIEKTGMYFITFTSYNWLRLIELANAYDAVYKFFDILNKKENQMAGYAIMPNHLHFLLYFNMQKQSLNTMIGNGKRFIGYEIINRLEAQKQNSILKILSEAVNPAERKRINNTKYGRGHLI